MSVRNDIIVEARRICAVTIDALHGLSFDTDFIRAVEHLSMLEGALFFLGVGKSGIIAHKLSATFASLGFPAFYIHPTDALHGDMGRIRAGDSIIALSHSGTTVELIEALQAIQKRGVTLIAITGNSYSPLASRAQYTLLSAIPREACPWNIVPTTSLVTAMVIGDALALCTARVKACTKEDFAQNHPKGALGALLYNMVDNIMQRENLPIVYVSQTLGEALEVLHNHNSGAVFVVTPEHIIQGVITDGDIRRLLIHNNITLERPVIEYMNRSPKVGTLTMTTAQLLDTMECNAITVLPIVNDENILQGILHIHDILGRGTISFY